MLASAISLALVVPTSIAAGEPAEDAVAAESWLESQPWHVETDFYGVFVAYGRAELSYRRARNRHCALQGNLKTSMSHVLASTRERLDMAEQRIRTLWPDYAAKNQDLLRNMDAVPVKRCKDSVAADEAFGAMIATRDAAELLIKMAERYLNSAKGT